MNALIKRFWDICRLQSGPEELPASTFLLGIALVAFLFVDFLISLNQLSFGDAVMASLVEAGIMGLLPYIVLWIRLMPQRWPQTYTALLGTGTVIGVIALPLGFWQHMSMTATGQIAALPSLLLIALLVWNLVIVAHILRHALSVPMLLAGVFAGVYMYIQIRVITNLFFIAE